MSIIYHFLQYYYSNDNPLDQHANHMNDELLVKYLLGEANASEVTIVDQWISASPENKRYFVHFQLIWDTSKKIIVPTTVNPDEAWQKFRKRTTLAKRPSAPVKKMTSRFTFIRAASIVVLCIGAVALAFFLSKGSSVQQIIVKSTFKPRPDTLPDGSLVVLNKNSSIAYSSKFKGDKRRVDLKGEAFFNVKPDKQKPFIITVNEITVTVVGTSFNIRSVGGKTEVLVEAGIVRVTKNGTTLELRPHEKVVVANPDSSMKKELVTDRLHEYYRSREFVCDKTPLWKLVQVLNEAYDVNIVFANDKLRSLELNTTFQNESLDRILYIISETFEISVERQHDQIILK